MRTESLLNELRELKQSKPVVELPRSQKRKERYMRFEEEHQINLQSKEKKKVYKRQGMFENNLFCFPLIDAENDPAPSVLTQLAIGIKSQGGRIVQFRKDLVNKQCEYVLVDERSDIGWIRQNLKGKLLYLSIIDYRWVEQSLRRFTKLNIAPFNLENKYTKKHPEIRCLSNQVQLQDLQKQNHKNQQKCKNINDFERSGVIEDDIKSCGIMNENGCKQSMEAQINQQNESNGDSDGTEIMQQQPNDAKPLAQQIQNKQQNNSECSFNSEPYVQDQFQRQFDVDQWQRMQQIQPKLCDEEDSIKYDEIGGQREQKLMLANDVQQNTEEEVLTEKMESEDEGGPTQKKAQEKIGYYRMPKKLQSVPQPKKQEQCARSLKVQPQNRKKTKLSIGSHQFSVNNGIVQMLKKMQQHYQTIGDRKSYAYLRAIACIKNYGKSITSAEELRDVQGIGRQMREKVRQFLKTGSIRKIDQKVNNVKSVPHKELLRVFGIGPTTAQELYHKGIRTIEDLEKNKALLNKNQVLGLRYLRDFEQRIPREKVGRMLQFVRQTLFYLVRSDSHHEIEAVGSFRRGKATCGDMDILITRRDGYVEKNLLQHLVTELEKRRFITDHITFPKNYDGHSSVNYMGVCRLGEETHHRIDLKHYPVEQYAFALLYFTGSDLFNREMRMHAHEKGLMLSDHNIKKKERNGQGKIWKGGKIPVCYTEKDIFQLLEMEYRAPAQREL